MPKTTQQMLFFERRNRIKRHICPKKIFFDFLALKINQKLFKVFALSFTTQRFINLMRLLTLFVILFVGWLLMSGHYNGLLIGLGVASCALCAWLSLRIGATDSEGLPIHLFSRLFPYLTWLIGEIILSNIATAKIILRGTADPEIFEVPANQTTSAGLANYANSITLTPGTVTVDIDEAKTGTSRFLVHALHPQFGDDVRGGDMDRRNCGLEGMGTMLSGSKPLSGTLTKSAAKKVDRKSPGSISK